MPTKSELSDRLASFVTVPRYRWRALVYGIKIRFAQPAFELIRFAIVLAGLIVSLSVGTDNLPSKPSSEIWGAIAVGFLLVAYIAVRYLSDLSKIMDIAAWSEEGATRIRRDMALGMRNETAYQQLIELYRPIMDEINRELIRRGSNRRMKLAEMKRENGKPNQYAAVGLAANTSDSLAGLLGHIDKGKGEWKPERFRTRADSRQRLMRKWRLIDDPSRTREDERGDNYCMVGLHIEPDQPLRLDVGVGTYGEIMRSCDALINEFALFAYLAGPLRKRWRLWPIRRGVLRMSPAVMLRRLPWRNRIHRDNRARPRDLCLRRLLRCRDEIRAGNLFMRPLDRAAGIGIAVVTLDKPEMNGQEENAYLGVRSGVVGTYPATNHVVPAGMCNTYGTHFVPQWTGSLTPPDYLETAMQCEFLEEWFGEKELENNRRRNWKERVKSKWDAKALDGHWTTAFQRWGKVKPKRKSVVIEPLKLTGIAFDLLNLRPEVCATAVVDTKKGELNWEFDEIGIAAPLATMGMIEKIDIVQSGAAALMLAKMSRDTKDSSGRKQTKAEPG